MSILPHPPSLAVALTLAAALPSVCADCIDAAAARHHVNTVVLRAIGWQESRLNSRALGRNADGSIDVGAFQINSVHLAELARLGVDRTSLADGCVSAEVAAWHYRRQVERQGNTWLAVGAYHSHTAARAAWYANRIAAILMQWKVMPAGALPFQAVGTLAPNAPNAPNSPPEPPGPPGPPRPKAPSPPNALNSSHSPNMPAAPGKPDTPAAPAAPDAPETPGTRSGPRRPLLSAMPSPAPPTAAPPSAPEGAPPQAVAVLAFTPSAR